MKKRLFLLPLLFVTTSCIPVNTNIQITYDVGAIISIAFYELEDNYIDCAEIEEFNNFSYTGLVDTSYIDTLMQEIQNTTYVDKKPIFVVSDPNSYFYDDTIYINFADGQTLILCSYLGVLYDYNDTMKEHWLGYNEQLTTILENCKNNYLK